MQCGLTPNNETIEAIKVALSGLAFFVSLGTFIYLILSTRRTSITETITKERVDWIRQARKALLDFAQNYRDENKNGMKEAKACLEMLMRRDTPEYRLVLEHLDDCLSDTEYDEDNYKKLLGLSSYILARAWQRIKLDGSKIWTNNEKKNDLVSCQVYPMLREILGNTYFQHNKLENERITVIYKDCFLRNIINLVIRISHVLFYKARVCVMVLFQRNVMFCGASIISVVSSTKEIRVVFVKTTSSKGRECMETINQLKHRAENLNERIRPHRIIDIDDPSFIKTTTIQYILLNIDENQLED